MKELEFPLQIYTKSHTAERLGIDNTPNPREIRNIKLTHYNIVEPIYVGLMKLDLFDSDSGRRFVISSGYRSKDLNTAIKGSKNSQHIKGQAVDFELIGYSNLKLWKICKESLEEYDQLILENHDGRKPQSGWIHCSYVHGGPNRKMAFTNKKCKYLNV